VTGKFLDLLMTHFLVVQMAFRRYFKEHTEWTKISAYFNVGKHKVRTKEKNISDF
jgi:hypothetical protein